MELSDAGMFTDGRDGKKYRMTVIGGSVWLAQNLNYQPQSGQSWCYGNDISNCDKYGRLYIWETAKNACPAGWRLPSPQDWEDLVTASGGGFEASYKLRAQSGWADEFDGEEMGDDGGFAAKPGGCRVHSGGEFNGIGYFGYWWSATEDGGAYERFINCCGDDGVGEVVPNDGSGNSVRCVRNESEALKAQRSREETRKKETAAQRIIDEERRCVEEERRKKQTEEQLRQKGLDEISAYFTDSRDGRKYRAVKIGKDTWMAQNLNYQPENGNSRCYGDSASYCDEYGRLYDWETAKNACPSGWRLPSKNEWDDLMLAAGGKFKRFELYPGWLDAGTVLKAKTDWACYKGKSGNGTDAYGFSALPGGEYDNIRGFKSVGYVGTWWMTGSDIPDYLYCSYITYGNNVVMDILCKESDGNSVRCVKDKK
jgi:uncharacterized protein (TIGR02145 family)